MKFPMNQSDVNMLTGKINHQDHEPGALLKAPESRLHLTCHSLSEECMFSRVYSSELSSLFLTAYTAARRVQHCSAHCCYLGHDVNCSLPEQEGMHACMPTAF